MKISEAISKRLDAIVDKHLTWQKMYGSTELKKTKKIIFKRKKKCQYDRCTIEFLPKAGGQRFCAKHAKIKALETKRKHWKKWNEIKKQKNRERRNRNSTENNTTIQKTKNKRRNLL